MTAAADRVSAPPKPRDSDRAYVGIGANVGDPLAAVRDAVESIQALPGTAGFVQSPLYRTAPVDASGPDFINAVVGFDTPLGGLALLRELQAIERRHGRRRPYRNAPRTLDLDLLLLGEQRIDVADLTVPHPRMHLRAFVLQPLLDLAPGVVIPGLGPAAGWRLHAGDQAIERVSP